MALLWAPTISLQIWTSRLPLLAAACDFSAPTSCTGWDIRSSTPFRTGDTFLPVTLPHTLRVRLTLRDIPLFTRIAVTVYYFYGKHSPIIPVFGLNIDSNHAIKQFAAGLKLARSQPFHHRPQFTGMISCFWPAGIPAHGFEEKKKISSVARIPPTPRRIHRPGFMEIRRRWAYRSCMRTERRLPLPSEAHVSF